MPVVHARNERRESTGRMKAARAHAPLEVVRAADGQLAVARDGASISVRVCRCFPWTQPGAFVSLRDEKENEVALIESLEELDPTSRQIVEEGLAEAGFVFEILGLESAEELYEVRHWRVRTRQGPRSFQTALDEWPRVLPGGGYLIKDVAGDLFCIRDPQAMDERTRKMLWTLAD